MEEFRWSPLRVVTGIAATLMIVGMLGAMVTQSSPSQHVVTIALYGTTCMAVVVFLLPVFLFILKQVIALRTGHAIDDENIGRGRKLMRGKQRFWYGCADFFIFICGWVNLIRLFDNNISSFGRSEMQLLIFSQIFMILLSANWFVALFYETVDVQDHRQ